MAGEECISHIPPLIHPDTLKPVKQKQLFNNRNEKQTKLIKIHANDAVEII